LETLRKTHAGAETRLSDLFADVVRAVMGSQVKAMAKLLERGIDLRADRNGDLYGAALETIKVLSFDIAGMAASIEGAGLHPRFLIHDGPREADMARVIYERFLPLCPEIGGGVPGRSRAEFSIHHHDDHRTARRYAAGKQVVAGAGTHGSKSEGRLLKVDL